MKLLIAILLMFLPVKKRTAEYVIVWHYPQCKDCVNEIGAFLNEQGIRPKIGLRLEGQPEIAVFARSREIAAQATFVPDTVTSLPDIRFGERKYPYLLRIDRSDTLELSYETLYDELGNLRKTKVRSFTK